MSKCASRKNRAVIKIEQYCKRRKDRMKPKWQEDSSCVFAYYFCRGTCQRRDTAGKRKSAEITSAQVRKKKLCKSRQDDTAGKSSRERQALLAPGAHSRFGSGKNSQFKPER